MPPTDPDQPERGYGLDDEFWEELSDFLQEPPRRPEPPPQPTAPVEPALPDVPASPESSLDDSLAAAGEPVHEGDDAGGADDWWDEVWDDVPAGEAEPTSQDEAEPPGGEDGGAHRDGEDLEEAPEVPAQIDDEPRVEDEGTLDEPGVENGETLDEAEEFEEAAPEEAAPDDEHDAPDHGDAAIPEPSPDADDEPATPGVGDEPGPADRVETGGDEWPRFAPDATPVVEEPPRRRRRRVPARVQRRIAIGVLVATVVAVVGFVGPVRGAFAAAARSIGNGTATASGAFADRWRSWSTELQTIAAGLPARQIDEQRQLEGSESLLFVIVDGDRRTVGVALLALAPEGDSTLALLPASLYDILPGYGDFPLSDATVFEGADLTAVTVANVLGVRIDDTITLGPGEVAAVLGGAIQVDLPTPLIVDEGGGTERVLAQAGPAERSAEMAETLMVVRGNSDQLQWLQRQTAVWQGMLDAVASDPGVPTRFAAFAAEPSAAIGTLARAAAGDPVVTVVPVTRVALAGAEEGFKVSYDDATAFVASRMPHLLLREGDRPRVEVLNGNGRILTTRTVADALIGRGFRVVKTDNAENFDFATTLVIAQGREHRADADEVLDALGTGELLLELRAPSGVVDVSIIVGNDIPAGEE